MKKIDVFELPVFPPADVFPMMSEDELQELAADIRANGLNQPLVVAEIDGDLVLVDGRNRRAACELAKVEPEVRHLNGEDPNAYVLSANVHRRHMTKGQRAMAVAMISPEPEKGGRGKKAVRDEHVSRPTVEKARTVLRYARDLAETVLAGATSLDNAYQAARDRKNAASSEESRLADLRFSHPELADKVVEGDLTLAGALAGARERDARAKTQRANLFSQIGKIVYFANTIGSDENVRHVGETLRAHAADFQTQERCSLDELIAACELAHHYLPSLMQSIRDQGDGDADA
jgi:hypothetical protein